jgi:hypothetical protein
VTGHVSGTVSDSSYIHFTTPVPIVRTFRISALSVRGGGNIDGGNPAACRSITPYADVLKCGELSGEETRNVGHSVSDCVSGGAEDATMSRRRIGVSVNM